MTTGPFLVKQRLPRTEKSVQRRGQRRVRPSFRASVTCACKSFSPRSKSCTQAPRSKGHRYERSKGHRYQGLLASLLGTRTLPGAKDANMSHQAPQVFPVSISLIRFFLPTEKVFFFRCHFSRVFQTQTVSLGAQSQAIGYTFQPPIQNTNPTEFVCRQFRKSASHVPLVFLCLLEFVHVALSTKANLHMEGLHVLQQGG